MKTIRVVFLDFDGVLNSSQFMDRLLKAGEKVGVVGIDPLAVSRVNRIVEASGAEIVVSSTWRHGRTIGDLQRELSSKGFEGQVLGVTPRMSRRHWRGLEIQDWIDGAEGYGYQVESFVILDDDSDMLHLCDRLVQTSFERGLEDEHVERAISLLAAPVPPVAEPTAGLVARLARRMGQGE